MSFEIVRPKAHVHQGHQMMVAVAIVSLLFVGEKFVEVLSVCNSWSSQSVSQSVSQFLFPEIFMG